MLKPADQTPLSSYALVELFEEAGLPNGALNIISGPGSTVGEAIVKMIMLLLLLLPEVQKLESE